MIVKILQTHMSDQAQGAKLSTVNVDRIMTSQEASDEGINSDRPQRDPPQHGPSEITTFVETQNPGFIRA